MGFLDKESSKYIGSNEWNSKYRGLHRKVQGHPSQPPSILFMRRLVLYLNAIINKEIISYKKTVTISMFSKNNNNENFDFQSQMVQEGILKMLQSRFVLRL